MIGDLDCRRIRQTPPSEMVCRSAVRTEVSRLELVDLPGT